MRQGLQDLSLYTELHRWQFRVRHSGKASQKRRPLSSALKEEQHLTDKKGIPHGGNSRERNVWY